MALGRRSISLRFLLDLWRQQAAADVWVEAFAIWFSNGDPSNKRRRPDRSRPVSVRSSIATVEGIMLYRKVRSRSERHRFMARRELFFIRIMAGLQPPITVPSLIRGIVPRGLLGQLQKVS